MLHPTELEPICTDSTGCNDSVGCLGSGCLGCNDSVSHPTERVVMPLFSDLSIILDVAVVQLWFLTTSDRGRDGEELERESKNSLHSPDSKEKSGKLSDKAGVSGCEG